MRLHGLNAAGQQQWVHEFDNLTQPGTPTSNVQTMGPIGADGQLYVLRCAANKTRLQTFDTASGTLTTNVEIPVSGCAAQAAPVLLDNGLLVTTI